MSDEISVVLTHKKFCMHRALLVDETLEFVECKTCGERLNPFFAIKQLMRLSERWHRERAELELVIEQAKTKTRTKCEHCKKMTKIRTDVKFHQVIDRMRENGAKV